MLIENLLAIRRERIICMVVQRLFTSLRFSQLTSMRSIINFHSHFAFLYLPPMVKRQLTLFNIPYNLFFALSAMKRDKAKTKTLR